MADLRINFAGIKAPNPFWLASAPPANSGAQIHRAFEAGWPLLRVGGTIVLVGAVFPGAPVELSLEQVVRRLLTIRGVHNYAPRHLERAIEFLTAHHRDAPFASLVSRWYPLREVELAFEESQRSDVIRVGVAPAGP